MSAVVADTHAILWYLSGSASLSANGLAVMRACASSGEPIYVSSMTVAEIVYLVEKGRVTAGALSALDDELDDDTSVVQATPFGLAVARRISEISRADVPDMPDRIIAATALHLGLPLITRDSKIRASGVMIIW